MEAYAFYCQSCDAKIGAEGLGKLEEGKCPVCASMKGFSTLPRDENDAFEGVHVLNDTEFL